MTRPPDRKAGLDAEVAVVGYGPVGMVIAALLGRRGHSVVVLERYPGLYNLPRAGVFDDETMRTLAALGIAEQILPNLKAPQRYWFQNDAGERLMEFDLAEFGRSGWAEMYGFYQPDLEDALDIVCRKLPEVDVRHSARVSALVQNSSSVTLTVTTPEATETVTARYVVACDGGNSFVRQHLGIDQDDYGFGEAWMVCDFKLHCPVDLPMMQVCDPRQPTAVVPIGLEYQRISFMLDSELDFEKESQPERVWHRAARYLRPDEAVLIRVGTYTFRSLVAGSWRVGRVLLAGDAAHQMPPFLGQGMCSGIRDAQNLGFKLDLVLRGRNPDVLDTYQAERDPHVRAVIERGIELGRVQTVRDPVIAAERDRRLIAQRAAGQMPAQIRLPGLIEGLLAAHSGPGRGELSVQGIVDDGAGPKRLDSIAGHGFHLLVTAALLPELERRGSVAALRAAGVAVVGLADQPSTDGAVVDVDATYRHWFTEHRWVAVAVRPDFYVYGTAVDTHSAVALVDELANALAVEMSMPERDVPRSANRQGMRELSSNATRSTLDPIINLASSAGGVSLSSRHCDKRSALADGRLHGSSLQSRSRPRPPLKK
jgi:2-polyprenyl-6-methoxyphenol hydroxylase-like FAD-dependent oxidoreductase